MTKEEDDKTVCTPGDKEQAGRLLKALAATKAKVDEATEQYETARDELQALMEQRGYDVVDNEDGGLRAVYFLSKAGTKVDEKKLFATVCEKLPEAAKLRSKLEPSFTTETVTKAFLKLTKG